jgi:hypothetical protein
VPAVASSVAYVVPVARPGPQAPLGWSLSQFARRDLDEQLRSPANLCQIALVRSWFDATPPAGTGRCVTGFAVDATSEEESPEDSVSLLVGRRPVETDQGRVGVVVSVTPCDRAAMSTRCRVSTDASGRFHLILDPAMPVTLRVVWGDARLDAPQPAKTGAIDTSINFLVEGDGPG